ncbi:hypothetical protein TYRP_001359 [Tyrophagus putrescentiae]|nr:hypothetical protein TYRP_001359 [Tyrophagus putrescentiae]
MIMQMLGPLWPNKPTVRRRRTMRRTMTATVTHELLAPCATLQAINVVDFYRLDQHLQAQLNVIIYKTSKNQRSDSCDDGANFT